MKDKAPAIGFHDALCEPGQRHPRGGAREPARGAAAFCKRPASTCKGRQLVNKADGRAARRGVPGLRPEPGALRAALQQALERHRHRRLAAPRRSRAVPEPLAQLRLRHHHDGVAGVAVARQRAARLLGLGRRRPAGLAQPRRHQGCGRRRADRAGDLRQGPARTGRRYAGARPGAAGAHYVVPQWTSR